MSLSQISKIHPSANTRSVHSTDDAMIDQENSSISDTDQDSVSIQFSVKSFLPSRAVIYNYFYIMESLGYIDSVAVMQKRGKKIPDIGFISK